MIVTMVLAAIVFALMFPETPTGRFAKRHFVDAPAQWLNNLSPVKIVALVVLTMVVTICSTAFPAELALIAAGDLTAYIEIAITLAVVASRLRIRQFASRIAVAIRQIPDKARRFTGALRSPARRSRTVRPSKSASSDEDETPVFA